MTNPKKFKNYKEAYERLERDYNNLKLQLRSKETIIKAIIKKLKLTPPYENFASNLKRMNFDDLIILENKIK